MGDVMGGMFGLAARAFSETANELSVLRAALDAKSKALDEACRRLDDVCRERDRLTAELVTQAEEIAKLRQAVELAEARVRNTHDAAAIAGVSHG